MELLVLGSQNCFTFAAVGGGGGSSEYSPIFEIGINFHAGETGKSITGSTGYTFAFRAEKRKAFFRTQTAAEFEYAKGNASIGSSTSAYTLTEAAFALGFYIFPFTLGRFQPFVGGSGIYAWHLLKLGAPPAGVEANSQSTGFGYEMTLGADLRFGSLEGNAVRILSTLSTITGKLAGISGFQLSGYKLLLGFSY